MKNVTLLLAVVVAMFVSFANLPVVACAAEARPADRVVVMYFHRTQRCPTCQKMGAYTEESVSGGFADQVKAGKVSFHNIDLQNEKNAAFTKAYQVAGPSLIVAQVKNNKVVTWKNLAEMWGKANDKDAFLKYVRSNVQGYLN